MPDNIILKTIKEVEFFNTRTFLEIFAKERNAYVILSECKIFDVDNLKNYLIENDLNHFAKNEIKNLFNAIDYFLKLYNKHRELPISEKFYHYKNENSWGKVEASGWGNLLYILHRNDKFMKINEMRFKENHTAELIYTSLSASRISTKLNEIKDLFADFIESENINNEVPQQTEAVNPDGVKTSSQHSQIFKNNNFEIWQRMFDDFNITKSSRTDIDFMFQIMKYESLIWDNIGLTDMQNWINETYQIAVEKVKYTDPNSKSNEKRMIAYNLINPK